ncbi:Spindle assembly checkpoint kinase [Phytophthora citrophthora]|uniref:Spindle assembly checkpoint kinase n=1 Tax=Phytophthora citrophthora TaxID=4793 RepID=A0AAD9LP77_9STRA|nr:Spindle assembly checkpoint kinase [Phytophthora citrophthora]
MATVGFPIVGLMGSPDSGSTLSGMTSRCRRMPENALLCKAVVERLQFLHESVAPLDAKDPLKKKYMEIVVKFVTLMRRKPLLQRLANCETLVTTIHDMQHKISDLAQALHVQDAPEMTKWETEWDVHRAEQYGILNRLVSDASERMLVTEVRGDKKVQEAIMSLNKSIQWRNQSPEMVELKKNTFSRVSGYWNREGLRMFDWFIPIDNVEFEDNMIGTQGTFGHVSRGIWTHDGERTDVVIKQLFPEMAASDDDSFLRQLELWNSLPPNEHILKLYGGSHVSSPQFYVCENAPNGNLADFLADGEHGVLFWRLFKQVALGLQFLHSANTVHGGLKCNNILVGTNFTTKLADFTFTSVRSLSAGLSKGSKEAADISVRWKPKEVLEQAGNEAPRFESDIYSLAMCMIEAKTEAIPFEMDDDPQTAMGKIMRGEEYPRPEQISVEEWAFISRLCDPDYKKRPSLDEVLEEISVFADAEEQQHPTAKLVELMEKLFQMLNGALTRVTTAEVEIPVKVDKPDWKIPANEVSVNFYEGGGEWLDTPVDVRKVIDQDNSFFEREVDLWGGLSHPNISNLMGFCVDEDGGQYFVMEPGENGNVVKYLKDSKDVWRVLYEASLALEYLHERGVVHAGIKPDNVRIGRDGRAKLTGLECSMLMERLNAGETVTLRRDFRWHVPELLTGSQPSFTSDIYSFAMLILAVVSGEPPFGVAVSDEEAHILLEQGQLPPRLGDVSDDHWQLVNEMFCLNAGERINAHKEIATGSSTEALWSMQVETESKWLESTEKVKSVTCSQSERLERIHRPPTSESETHSWTIPQHELFFEESERRGSFGIVERHLGKWLNAEVLIARVCIGNSALDMKHQAELWFTLKHPNVQQLYGACEPHGLFVCEYPESGNLCSYLRRHPDQVWKKLLDISLGLRYLNHRGIVHGNLKTHHFLVDRHGRAKLSDLESCLIGQHAAVADEPDEELEVEEKRLVSSYECRWRSPQCLNGERETFESDVYSLGKCFIEAVTGEIPEGNFLPDIAVTGRLSQCSSFGSHYDRLIQGMCSDNEKRRPTMAVVVQRLSCFVAVDDEMKATTLLGMGAFANVHLGEWLHISVAVKKLKCKTEAMTDTMTKDFDQEVKLWYRLSHPHIVNLYGASRCPPYPLFISECASNGTLGSYVKKIPKDDRWSLLYESALGLQAIHARGVIHADLKCDNILVMDTGQAKIADFGLSINCDQPKE